MFRLLIDVLQPRPAKWRLLMLAIRGGSQVERQPLLQKLEERAIEHAMKVMQRKRQKGGEGQQR